MTKEIFLLYSGKLTEVDDEDYGYYNQWNWGITDEEYVIRGTSRTLGARKHILLHREIINCPNGLFVDHIDGNRLNNQKGNLRICTNQQNQRNRGKTINNTSGYKGVCKVGNKWQAQVHNKKENIYLGLWDTPEEAFRAYESKCKELFGEFFQIKER